VRAEPGRTYRIEGVESRVLQLEQKPRFRWWDPSLYLALQSGVVVYPPVQASAGFSLQFSVMSYGDWAFVGLSGGYDGVRNAFIASIIPFSYNVGHPLPLLEDLRIFPYISADHRGGVGIGVGIGTRL